MKFEKYLTEASEWKRGSWIVQRRSSDNEYAILVDQLKGDNWSVVSIDDDRMVAAKKTTKGWYPVPQVLKDKSEIPQKLLNKVQKKLDQLGIDLKV